MKHLPIIILILALSGLTYFGWKKWYKKPASMKKLDVQPTKKVASDKGDSRANQGGGIQPREYDNVVLELDMSGLRQMMPGQLEIYFKTPNSLALMGGDTVQILNSSYNGTFKVVSAKSNNNQTTSAVIDYTPAKKSFTAGYTDWNAVGKLKKL